MANTGMRRLEFLGFWSIVVMTIPKIPIRINRLDSLLVNTVPGEILDE